MARFGKKTTELDNITHISNTDYLKVSVLENGDYISKKITPNNIINSIISGELDTLNNVSTVVYTNSALWNSLPTVSSELKTLISEISATIIYTNTTPVPTTIGGISAGTTFNNVSIESMFDMLLYPYQSPAFSSFTSQYSISTLEVGYTLSSPYIFNWGTTNTSNISANSILIKDITGGNINIATELSNSGPTTVSHTNIQKATPSSHTFSIQGINTQNTTFSRNLTYTWLWRIYYGNESSTSLTEEQIEALSNNNLQSSYSSTYNFALSAGTYKYICFPSTFGSPTNFKDALTNLNVPMNNIDTITMFNNYDLSAEYSIWRTVNPLGGAINIIVT
jgi:hypothetical protein